MTSWYGDYPLEVLIGRLAAEYQVQMCCSDRILMEEEAAMEKWSHWSRYLDLEMPSAFQLEVLTGCLQAEHQALKRRCTAFVEAIPMGRNSRGRLAGYNLSTCCGRYAPYLLRLNDLF